MQDLITIDIRDGEPTVNARDLHAYLEIPTKFADWIKRQLEDGRFKESRDYVVLKNENTENQGFSPRFEKVEYFLSINTAKHIAMMSKTQKGYEAREYFIDMEARYLAERESYFKIRGKSKATRIKFTDTLKEHGYKARHEYIQTTMQMKEAVGITAAKGDMDADELTVIEAAESIARLNIKRAGVKGYSAVNPVAVKSAKAIGRAVGAKALTA